MTDDPKQVAKEIKDIAIQVDHGGRLFALAPPGHQRSQVVDEIAQIAKVQGQSGGNRSGPHCDLTCERSEECRACNQGKKEAADEAVVTPGDQGVDSTANRAGEDEPHGNTRSRHLSGQPSNGENDAWQERARNRSFQGPAPEFDAQEVEADQNYRENSGGKRISGCRQRDQCEGGDKAQTDEMQQGDPPDEPNANHIGGERYIARDLQWLGDIVGDVHRAAGD